MHFFSEDNIFEFFRQPVSLLKQCNCFAKTKTSFSDPAKKIISTYTLQNFAELFDLYSSRR